MVMQALAAATGRQESLIKKQYDESGDLGTVASAARATQRTMFQPHPLNIPGVLKSVLFGVPALVLCFLLIHKHTCSQLCAILCPPVMRLALLTCKMCHTPPNPDATFADLSLSHFEGAS